jgi:hypothetical protein
MWRAATKMLFVRGDLLVTGLRANRRHSSTGAAYAETARLRLDQQQPELGHGLRALDEKTEPTGSPSFSAIQQRSLGIVVLDESCDDSATSASNRSSKPYSCA